MQVRLTLNCLTASETAPALAKSAILTAPVGQLRARTVILPRGTLSGIAMTSLGTMALNGRLRAWKSRRKAEFKKAGADLFKGAGGNGEVSGELRGAESLHNRTSHHRPSSRYVHIGFIPFNKPD